MPQHVSTSATIAQIRTRPQKRVQAGTHGFGLQSVGFTVFFSQGSDGVQARDGLVVTDGAVCAGLPQMLDLDLQLFDVGAQLGAVLYGLPALGPAIARPDAGKQRRHQQQDKRPSDDGQQPRDRAARAGAFERFEL
ncbi:hypothetical protein D0A35_22055 [Xanthomonas campestris]|nr:hypothetical protein D0A35_22055 [Xanthomonas campestris]